MCEWRNSSKRHDGGCYFFFCVSRPSWNAVLATCSTNHEKSSISVRCSLNALSVLVGISPVLIPSLATFLTSMRSWRYFLPAGRTQHLIPPSGSSVTTRSILVKRLCAISHSPSIFKISYNFILSINFESY